MKRDISDTLGKREGESQIKEMEQVEQTDEEVKKIVLDVLTKPHNGHKEFLPQGTFYRKAVFGGYSGKEERLNNLASNMNEVENANIGMFHLTHYRLRRDN